MDEKKNPYSAPSAEAGASDAFSSGSGNSDFATPMAIISICVGLVGFFWICCCVIMIVPTACAAIVTGAIAVYQCPPHDQTPKILGIIGIAIGALELMGFAALFLMEFVGPNF
jgi:hypothetical protein